MAGLAEVDVRRQLDALGAAGVTARRGARRHRRKPVLRPRGGARRRRRDVDAGRAAAHSARRGRRPESSRLGTAGSPFRRRPARWSGDGSRSRWWRTCSTSAVPVCLAVADVAVARDCSRRSAAASCGSRTRSPVTPSVRRSRRPTSWRCTAPRPMRSRRTGRASSTSTSPSWPGTASRSRPYGEAHGARLGAACRGRRRFAGSPSRRRSGCTERRSASPRRGRTTPAACRTQLDLGRAGASPEISAPGLAAAVAAADEARCRGPPELLAEAALVLEPVPDPATCAVLARAVRGGARPRYAAADGAVRARLLARRSQLAFYAGDHDADPDAGIAALELARVAGDDQALVAALRARHDACPGPARRPGATPRWRPRCWRSADRTGDCAPPRCGDGSGESTRSSRTAGSPRPRTSWAP